MYRGGVRACKRVHSKALIVDVKLDVSRSARMSLIQSFRRTCTSLAFSSSGLIFSGVIESLMSGAWPSTSNACRGGADRTGPDLPPNAAATSCCWLRDGGRCRLVFGRLFVLDCGLDGGTPSSTTSSTLDRRVDRMSQSERGRLDSERQLGRVWAADRGDRPPGVALREHVGRAPVLPLDGRGPVAQQAYRGVEVDGAVDAAPVVFDAHVAAPACAVVLAIAVLRRLARRGSARALVLLPDAEDGCQRGTPRRGLVINRRRWGVRRIRLVPPQPQ